MIKRWKTGLEVRIISAIIVVVVVIVSAIGFMAYDRLSKIAQTLVEESRPDLKLVVLKGILIDLSKAESQIKSYTISNEDKYLETYYYTISEIDDKIDALRTISDTLSVSSKNKIDSIAVLIEKKFSVWDEMIEVSQSDQLSDVFNEIKARIEYKKQRAAVESRLDELERQRNLENEKKKQPEKKKEISNPEPSEEPVKEEKSNIFKRLFGNKVKDINDAATKDSSESNKVVEFAQKTEKGESHSDSSENAFIPSTKIARDNNPRVDIQSDIARIQRKEGIVLSKKRERELEILSKDKVISSQIQLLISDLEGMEMKEFEKRAFLVEEQASKTNASILVFCIAISFLLLMVFFLIGRYVRQTNEYHKVLKSAKKKAEDLARAKEMFLANMSHEIRTPMNSILGFTEQALKKVKGKEESDILKIVMRSSEHLLKVINDVLDFSKLKTDKMNFNNQDFSPKDLITEVYNMLKIQAEKKNIRFECRIIPGIPIILNGDVDKLKQVLINIIGNAIKFTEDGMVTIAVNGKKVNNKSCVLEIKVSDTGIGIPSDRIEQIFEEFTQGEAKTNNKYGGTGLGLAISKQLIEQQNGSIQVSSEEHIGSVFGIRIPYTIVSSNKSIPKKTLTQPKNVSLKGMHYLIVDDAKYNRILLRTMLKNWEATFKEAVNGEEAITLLEKEPFDAVLMDARMPVMDGYETTRLIRNKLKSNIPVIALTAAIAQEDIQKFKESGMNEYLSKPFTEKQLHELLLKYPKKVKRQTDKKSPTSAKVDHTTLNKSTSHDKINLNHLIQLSQGDDGFVIEMLEVFIKTTQEGIVEIERSANNKNWGRVSDYAHKIAAPCRHLEAKKLLSIIKEIEECNTNTSKIGEIPKLVELLKVESKIVLEIVSSELNTLNSKAK